MELTWLALASLLFVGVGYAFVQRAPRPRFVRWSLLCTSLFAHATRDLFRPRERGPPPTEATETTSPDAPTTPADEPTTPPTPDRPDPDARRPAPLFARLRRRFAGWFD